MEAGNDKKLLKLIKGCRQGKLRAQEKLYRHFYAYGMSICLPYSKNKDEAAEILNDSFLKVFQNISSFDSNYPFKPWLRRIIINTAIDYYRQFFKHNSLIDNNIDELYDLQTESVDDLEIEDIMLMLNELPEIYRIVFNLYEIEGFSHKEIAIKIRVSESTSRSNLTRAKKMLRIIFKKKFQMNYEEIV